MDKNTLGHYGWLVVCILILAIMITLATPFASVIRNGVAGYVDNFKGVATGALDGIGSDTSFGGGGSGGSGESGENNTEQAYNLLDLSALTTGYYCYNGNLSENATYDVSDYIPCEAGDVIRLQLEIDGVRYDLEDEEIVSKVTSLWSVNAFDENKQYISGSMLQSVRTYTVPESASYVRITFHHSQHVAASRKPMVIISPTADVLPYKEFGSTVAE